MRKVNRDTAGGGVLHVTVKRKPTSRDRVLLKRVSHSRPDYTGRHVRAETKHQNRWGNRATRAGGRAGQRGRPCACDAQEKEVRQDSRG
jgi:hypothetical protein